MQIKTRILISLAAVAVSAMTASAVEYTYNDYDDLGGVTLINPGSVSGVFNINVYDGEGEDKVGYTPGTAINAAQVWFGVVETWAGSPSGFMTATLAPSTVPPTVPGTAIYTGTAVGTGPFGADILALTATLNLTSGIIDYTITAAAGEFDLLYADLRVWTVGFPDPAFGVPDGGATAGLLLLGLVGLVPLRKRFAV